MRSRLHISKPTLYLCASIFIMQAVHGFGTARNGGNPTILDAWYLIALFWAVGWWFIRDSQGDGIKWNDGFLDIGLFLYIAWIFILPYYLFKSRGWKAVYTIVLLVAVYFGAYITGVMIYLLSTL